MFQDKCLRMFMNRHILRSYFYIPDLLFVSSLPLSHLAEKANRIGQVYILYANVLFGSKGLYRKKWMTSCVTLGHNTCINCMI